MRFLLGLVQLILLVRVNPSEREGSPQLRGVEGWMCVWGELEAVCRLPVR